MGRHDGDRHAVAGNVEPVAQHGVPVRHAKIADPPAAGPQPLLDRADTRRSHFASRPADRARPVPQPAADPAAGQLLLVSLVTVGPELLSDIASYNVRVRRLAESQRGTVDRKPFGVVEK